MKIKSPEFEPRGILPDRFSQFHENHSPPLDFVDVPAGARSLVLILEDPDAISKKPFTHWVVFNIDANHHRLPENQLPKDVRLGRNDYGAPSYAGPKPPNGEHRYFFHLFALDDRLNLPEGATRGDVVRAIKGHVIEEAELIGRYATPVEAES